VDSDSFPAWLIPSTMSLLPRPKPPDPTINAGTPWSEDDLADLKYMVCEAYSPREIAEYLAREVVEIEAKIKERLGPVARQ